MQAISEYLRLWDRLQNFSTVAGQQDVVHWRWEASGFYSSRSAYKALFVGTSLFACNEALWRSWAPLKCKIFTWLAIRRRCWTADRLQRHGLQSQGVCVFCLLSLETIDHLIVGCAVTAQIWGQFFSRLGLSRCVPMGQVNISEFWIASRAKLRSKQKKKFLDSCIILVAWMIWKERNHRIFNQDPTSLDTLLHRITEEFVNWRLAGLRCLEALPFQE